MTGTEYADKCDLEARGGGMYIRLDSDQRSKREVRCRKLRCMGFGPLI